MDTSTVLKTEAKKLKNYPFHSAAADWLEAQKDREVIFLGWVSKFLSSDIFQEVKELEVEEAFKTMLSSE